MLETLLILLCIIMNGLLSGAETAFIATNRYTLRKMASTGKEKVAILLQLRENPERTLSVTQIGITFISALAAAIGGAGAEEHVAPWIEKSLSLSSTGAEIISIIIIVLPLTYFSVVIGELVPKTLALRKPLTIGLAAAPWLYYIEKIIFPLVNIFEWSTRKVVDLLPSFSHDERDSSQHQDNPLETISEENRQYIINVVRLERTTVKAAYIPWDQVDFVRFNASFEEIEQVIIQSGHTRLPVLENEHLVGILNTKQFLALRETGSREWKPLIKECATLQEDMPILAALRQLQANRSHMSAIYRGSEIIGIITLEAILEEIVGDIYDENDDGIILKILSAHKMQSS